MVKFQFYYQFMILDNYLIFDGVDDYAQTAYTLSDEIDFQYRFGLSSII